MKAIDQEIFNKVASRKSELMLLPPAQLRSFPEYSDESFSACGTAQVLGIWHHKVSLDQDIFVVQCKRYIFFGYGHMFAQGFVLDSSDNLREAEEELMWDYR